MGPHISSGELLGLYESKLMDINKELSFMKAAFFICYVINDLCNTYGILCYIIINLLLRAFLLVPDCCGIYATLFPSAIIFDRIQILPFTSSLCYFATDVFFVASKSLVLRSSNRLCHDKILDCPHRLLTVYPCRSCCKHGKSTVHSDGIVQFLVIRSIRIVLFMSRNLLQRAGRRRTIIKERKGTFYAFHSFMY
jgi:hypothetical protein